MKEPKGMERVSERTQEDITSEDAQAETPTNGTERTSEGTRQDITSEGTQAETPTKRFIRSEKQSDHLFFDIEVDAWKCVKWAFVGSAVSTLIILLLQGFQYHGFHLPDPLVYLLTSSVVGQICTIFGTVVTLAYKRTRLGDGS